MQVNVVNKGRFTDLTFSTEGKCSRKCLLNGVCVLWFYFISINVVVFVLALFLFHVKPFPINKHYFQLNLKEQSGCHRFGFPFRHLQKAKKTVPTLWPSHLNSGFLGGSTFIFWGLQVIININTTEKYKQQCVFLFLFVLLVENNHFLEITFCITE